MAFMIYVTLTWNDLEHEALLPSPLYFARAVDLPALSPVRLMEQEPCDERIQLVEDRRMPLALELSNQLIVSP
jgi:hypothetical protein